MVGKRDFFHSPKFFYNPVSGGKVFWSCCKVQKTLLPLFTCLFARSHCSPVAMAFVTWLCTCLFGLLHDLGQLASPSATCLFHLQPVPVCSNEYLISERENNSVGRIETVVGCRPEIPITPAFPPSEASNPMVCSSPCSDNHLLIYT